MSRRTLPWHLLRPTLLLGAAALLASSLLALGHQVTYQAIAQRQAEDLQASLSEVVPPGWHDNDLLARPTSVRGPEGQPLRIYRATRSDPQITGKAVTAVAFELTAPEGYGGPIRLLLGIAASGELLGVRVLSHSETPGLGDKLELKKSDWILGFNGRSLVNTPPLQWAVKKEGGQFDQFTGATITPRAVISGVHRGLRFFQSQRERLLAPPAAAEQGDH